MGRHPSRSAFPEELQPFCEQACAELSREIPPFTVEMVLERLTTLVTRDVRAVVGAKHAGLYVPPYNTMPERAAELHLPLPLARTDAEVLTEELDYHWQIGGDRSGLFVDYRSDYQRSIPLLIADLQKRFGKDLHRFGNLLQCWIERDYPQKPATEQDASPSNFHLISALSPLAGFSVAGRISLMAGVDFERGIDICLRLLENNTSVRYRMLLLLQNYRLLPHARLAQAVVRQGYHTFLQMEEMTEYDIWQKHKEEVERTARKMEQELEKSEITLADILASQKTIMLAIESMQISLEESDDPQLLLSVRLKEAEHVNIDHLHIGAITIHPESELPVPAEGAPKNFHMLKPDDQKRWFEARDYLETHAPLVRRPLIEVLECAKNRRELEDLYRLKEVHAAAAKERAIAANIFSAAARFAYPYEGLDSAWSSDRTYVSGLPVTAVAERKLNCFTGPWLMAALCMESGIPYKNMFYCSVNQPDDESRMANHGALLFSHRDGSLSFLDFGHHQCGRAFASVLIEDPKERREFVRLIESSEEYGAGGNKTFGDPVHVQVSQKTANNLKIYRDMHVLPLDQGLTAMMLLQQGIALLHEGKDLEAKMSFEMALVSFPGSPDVLCRLGMLAMRENDLERAEHYLMLSIDSYAAHPLTWYYLGVLALLQGKPEDASYRFKLLADDPRELWGDDSYKMKAKEWCALLSQRATLDHHVGELESLAAKEMDIDIE